MTLGAIDVLDIEISRQQGSRITCIHVSVTSEDLTKELAGQHVSHNPHTLKPSHGPPHLFFPVTLILWSI